MDDADDQTFTLEMIDLDLDESYYLVKIKHVPDSLLVTYTYTTLLHLLPIDCL